MRIEKIFEVIAKEGFTPQTLQEIDNYIKEIQHGREDFSRFNLSEHAGFCKGGAPLIGASIIACYARASITAGSYAEGSEGGPANWEIDELQEKLIEQWAKAANLWEENSEQILSVKFGPMIAQGAEAKVYYHDGDISVVKERTSIYSTWQKALDAIVLHNCLFPETEMKVIGFTRDSDQMLLLESIGELKKSSNFLPDARTRCIYENGTESDILLQTLRKNVVGDGYAVTELQEDSNGNFFNNSDITANDQVTGYIYVLSSLSQDPAIKEVKHLYKIGFSTNSVEQRIANAENEPTYLMAPVKIQASYKVVNMNSQKFEDLIHQLLKPVQFQVSVFDDKGVEHQPQEWFVVPLPVVDVIIQKIVDGSIVGYTYNPQQECLEKRIVKEKSTFDTAGMKVLTLNIKKIYYDEIMRGTKKIEYRELKQTTLNKYTYLDESDGKRYLRRYDAIRFFVGYHKDRESALVQVKDTTYSNGIVEYHLGLILEVLNKS